MKDLTSGNIYKTFILFAIPIVLSGLLTMCYNLIDTVIAGKFLGEAGLAAVGASGGFVSFISSIFWGYTNGFAVYLARLFGSGDHRHLKQAVYNFLVFTGAAAVLVSIVVIALRYPLLRLLNTDETVIDEAAKYFAVFFCGKLFMVTAYNATCILHAMGISTFPFYISLLSGLLNVAGNIFSVVVLGWGVPVLRSRRSYPRQWAIFSICSSCAAASKSSASLMNASLGTLPTLLPLFGIRYPLWHSKCRCMRQVC